MKLKNLLIVGIPPVVVVGSVAIFNPAILTWPMIAVISVVMGVFGGLALRLLENA